MWITSLLPRFSSQSFLSPALYFLLEFYFLLVGIGYTIFRVLGSLARQVFSFSIFLTLLEYCLHLLTLITLGLLYFLLPFLYQSSLLFSTSTQGGNVDLMAIFVQYALPMIGGGAIGGFFGWLSNKAIQKKNDAEAKKLSADAERIKSDTFLNEFDKLVEGFKEMIKARDSEIVTRGDIIIYKDSVIAEKDRVIASKDEIIKHMRDSLDYLREQARPFTPIAVAISYEIEGGRQPRPYSREGDDITETH